MSWKTIRLELARTTDFPRGSASRAYLLHLPLDEGGLIDAQEFSKSPALATVRRHWPNERDRTGYVIRKKNGYAFSYVLGDSDDEELYHLENHPLIAGEYITLTEPDGSQLPFRVMSCEGRIAA